MQFWETIINTAMMGTDKILHAPSDVPANLADTVALIDNNPAINKEEKFLQIATLAYNYRMSGVTAIKQEVNIPVAAAEEKNYCSSNATQVLKDILYEENIFLLQYWLEKCVAAQQIVQPELVPELLSIGVHQKKLQTAIAACCGKRGEWLSQFNTSWRFSLLQTDEELWHNGTFEQRKQVFAALRKTDPATARNWLEATWSVEDANTKTGFLELLHENVSEEDVPFLESLATEKSKKVKEEVLELLKKIPGSAVVRSYEDILRRSVILVKEKALLGLVSKTTLQFRIPSDVVIPAGIDKLSNNKDISDDVHILSQIAASCPPSFWEKHLQCSPAEALELFSRSAAGTYLIRGISAAVIRFKAAAWASPILKPGALFYSLLVPLVSKKEGEAYLTAMLALNNPQHSHAIIETAVMLDEEWGLDLTGAIFKYVAFNPYSYNKTFFNRIIHLIPAGMLPSLERFAPPEEYTRSTWNNNSEYIRRMVQLKIQSQKAFNV
jgi:hypothetical protein